jgi:CDP-diacylglycerol--glycerol-3-phosphate 3-phosphatidyltransferase
MKQIFNISNLLSISRILLVAPLFIFLSKENYYAVLLICLIAYVTDLLDGYFARKLNQISELGKILDPLADKVFVFVLALQLLVQGKIPVWFFVVIVLRDVLILLGGLFMKDKTKSVPASNMYGKVTVIIVAVTLILSMLNIVKDEYINYLMLLALCGLLLSFCVYLNRFIKLFKK